MRSMRSSPVGRKRGCVLLLAAGTILSVFLILFSPHTSLRNDERWRQRSSALPSSGGKRLRMPSFRNIWKMEKKLPQHDLALPFPEGKTGRYVKFSNQVYVLGWNNVLAESLLAAHLAWRAKRAYVFQDYRWNPEHFPWKDIKGIPLTPINALVSGPMAGGSWGPGENYPRAVSEKWFEKVCPPKEVRVIEAAIVKGPVRGKTAQEVMDYWAKLLGDAPERCINVVAGEGDSHPQTFDLWTISSPKIIPLWDEFSKGPVSQLLRPSPLVNSIVQANEHFLFPPANVKSRKPKAGYENLLAVHLRRGDYIEACKVLANWNSTFFGWNLLPDLPDQLHLARRTRGESVRGENIAENYETFDRRCLPSEEQLITRIRDVRADWEQRRGLTARPKLTTLFIMTNAKQKWLDPVVAQLRADGWENVVTSRDFIVNSEQLAVAMSADMEIARKGAVFIGNGWSSMSSNIVHQRLVSGQSHASCRLL